MKGDRCRVDGCDNLITSKRGLVCGMHLARYWRSKKLTGIGNYNYLSDRHLNARKPHLTNYGYYRVNINGERILQHRHIMETHLGRKLLDNERVHHINGDKTDNRIENLIVIANQSTHIAKYHPKKSLIDWSKYASLVFPKNNRWNVSKPAKCLIPACKEQSKHRGLCGKHYQSYHKNFLRK